MTMSDNPLPVEVFSTCPPGDGAGGPGYLARVLNVARWSEEAGYRGMLVCADHAQFDPWLLAHTIVEWTGDLCPLVAVQPMYMHPYTTAKLISSLACVWGRRVYLNMVAGGFTNDLKAFHDTTPHDRRYDRLIEYTTLVSRLLEGDGPVSFEGEFYQTSGLTLGPVPAPELRPGLFVSGASSAGLEAARTLGATAVCYPRPAAEEIGSETVRGPWGIRVGLIARERREEAWAAARARFPEDRRGALTHQPAMKVSDSQRHRDLSSRESTSGGLYWLEPFERYQTMCPYLVGRYDEVAAELSRYLQRGCAAVVLDELPDRAECAHIAVVFDEARVRVTA